MTTSQMWMGSFGMIDQNQLRETPPYNGLTFVLNMDNCLNCFSFV